MLITQCFLHSTNLIFKHFNEAKPQFLPKLYLNAQIKSYKQLENCHRLSLYLLANLNHTFHHIWRPQTLRRQLIIQKLILPTHGSHCRCQTFSIPARGFYAQQKYLHTPLLKRGVKASKTNKTDCFCLEKPEFQLMSFWPIHTRVCLRCSNFGVSFFLKACVFIGISYSVSSLLIF